MQRFGYRSVLAVPVVVRERTLGVLQLLHRERARFPVRRDRVRLRPGHPGGAGDRQHPPGARDPRPAAGDGDPAHREPRGQLDARLDGDHATRGARDRPGARGGLRRRLPRQRRRHGAVSPDRIPAPRDPGRHRPRERDPAPRSPVLRVRLGAAAPGPHERRRARPRVPARDLRSPSVPLAALRPDDREGRPRRGLRRGLAGSRAAFLDRRTPAGGRHQPTGGAGGGERAPLRLAARRGGDLGGIAEARGRGGRPPGARRAPRDGRADHRSAARPAPRGPLPDGPDRGRPDPDEGVGILGRGRARVPAVQAGHPHPRGREGHPDPGARGRRGRPGRAESPAPHGPVPRPPLGPDHAADRRGAGDGRVGGRHPRRDPRVLAEGDRAGPRASPRTRRSPSPTPGCSPRRSSAARRGCARSWITCRTGS